ncbi:transcription initiation factor TFIID subunit 9B isoform X3 [Nannospalax galili]|uniref:transcription initiation factor TFIID subunit 9B isoform X3 n=1 Tax=Nannospalax galili TaxID=1026970 RepID=UPI000819CEBD|nr:transcription initiation factor TFIID subunit 9B isoform X3 [Nannospalax galili]
MESSKMAPPKNAPRDALVMAQILKDMGITEYEPRVINQMLEFAFRYVTTILDDAKIYSSHAKKATVDADDVRLAIQCRADQSFTSPPPRDFLLDIARQKNQTPLPLIKPYAGPRLPPDRYCLTAPNYRLKSLIRKGTNQGRLVPRLSVGAVSSRPTTPTIVLRTDSRLCILSLTYIPGSYLDIFTCILDFINKMSKEKLKSKDELLLVFSHGLL